MKLYESKIGQLWNRLRFFIKRSYKKFLKRTPLCKIGLHSWKTIIGSDVRLLIRSIIRNAKEFGIPVNEINTNFNRLFVANKKCIHCGEVDNEYTYTKHLLIEKMIPNEHRKRYKKLIQKNVRRKYI